MNRIFLMATAGSPVAFPPVPRVEQVGEAVVGQPGDLAQARQAQEPPEPGLARRAPPDLDGAIGADMQAALRVDAVQPAANVLDSGGKARKRLRLEIDVAEFDRAGAGGAYQAVPLPVDTGITYRAARVVPHRQPGKRFRHVRWP